MDGNRIWAVGANGNNAVFSSYNSLLTTWGTPVTFSEVAGSGAGETVNAIITINANTIWVVGSDDNGDGGSGVIRFCSNGTCSTAADWTTTGQKLPDGARWGACSI